MGTPREPGSVAESLYWASYGAGRRSVVCDLSTEEGRDRARDLATRADVLLESSGPGALEAAGLGWGQLNEANPGLIYVSISAFGSEGPKARWPATDLTVWAAGGPLAYNRDEVGPPLRISVPQTFLHAGADAVAAALIALEARRRTGRGQQVDVSAQASVGLATLAAVLTAATCDEEPDWFPARPTAIKIDQSGSGSRTRRSKWRVKDGLVELHLSMGPAVGGFTNAFFAWMVEEGCCPDPEIAAWDWCRMPELVRQGGVTVEQMERAREHVAAFLATRTKAEVTAAALARRTLAVGVADVADLTSSEHLAARGFFVQVPGFEGAVMPGRFARIETGVGCAFVASNRAPALGEHTNEAPMSWAQPVRDEPARPAAKLPLEGLKVADLSWVVAGPLIGRTLADFGATVVRVESSTKVETARLMAPFYSGAPGVENSALYINSNAGKLGMTVDLTRAEGREIVHDLVAWADVVVESFTPGRMDAWGLGYLELSKDHAGLIMLSSSLMGNSGPMSRLAGFGNIGAAMSGFQHLVGWPDRPPIGPFGPYTDFVAPRFGLIAVLAALRHRERTGRGCYIDLAQAECGIWFLSPEIAAYGATGAIAGRRGNRDPIYAPHGVFPCRSDGPGSADHVAVAVIDEVGYRALAGLVGRPDWSDRYPQRHGDQDAWDEAIAAWTSTRTAMEVEWAAVGAGVAAHRASTSGDFLADAQLQHRGHIVRLAHPRHGEVVVEGPRYLLSATPGRVERVAPLMGEHTRSVLTDLLGYTASRVDALEQSGALK